MYYTKKNNGKHGCTDLLEIDQPAFLPLNNVWCSSSSERVGSNPSPTTPGNFFFIVIYIIHDHKIGHACLSVCVCVCVCVGLYLCVSVCVCVCLSIYLSVENAAPI